MNELIFMEDGVVIGDREKHNAVSISYGEMFKIAHQFLNEFYRQNMLINLGTKEGNFIRLKEGDGSPYPIEINYDGRRHQIKCEEVFGIKDFTKANLRRD